MKRKTGPKYVIMNGSCGCLPDNYMYAESIESALQQINELFNDLPQGAIGALRRNRIYYFGKRACEYGADYVEIADNTETTYAEIEAEMFAMERKTVKRSLLPSDFYTIEALATMDALARRGIEVDGSQWLGHGLGDDGRPYHGFRIASQARYFTLDGSEIEAAEGRKV